MEINLSANRISKINQDAFFDLSNLKILRLQQNRIQNVYELTFRPLKNLRILDLSYNQIETVPKNILLYNDKLIEVDFKFNKMYRIHQELPDRNLNNMVWYFEGNYLDEQKRSEVSEEIKQQFAVYFKAKKEFYVQIHNLMISYLTIVLVCLSFVGFVIYVLGAPRGIMTNNEIKEYFELTTIQRDEACEEKKEVEVLKVVTEDSTVVIRESSDDLYDEIGQGTSSALMDTSK